MLNTHHKNSDLDTLKFRPLCDHFPLFECDLDQRYESALIDLQGITR